jgi:hypothetical protein
MLILTQRHDATRISGFNAWRKLNSFVRKGEKAIWIIAPMRCKASSVFCDRCGTSVDTDLIHPDEHHHADDGDFYRADCWEAEGLATC